LKINSIHKSKGKLLTNKEIVSQYFRLLQNKDIDGLKDLFWSDATVYEPFSKLEHGLRGWSQIEPFLKVAIMANESLSNKIAFEESRRIKNKDLNDEEKNTSDSNNDIVEALVTFQKDNVIRAKFRFELSNQANTVDDSERKKIKALRIQFT
jgi:ketosteroid isomerase-like protein